MRLAMISAPFEDSPARIVPPLLCLLVFMVTATAAEQVNSDHLGEISASSLLSNYKAFASEYEAYSPTQTELRQIESLRGKEVIVLFGTWCHDSEREVPRLLKLIDQSGVDLQSLALFAVDRNKTDPDGFAARLELQYTPTIIVSEDGQVIARIIERPLEGLATDLQSQLSP
jgi:thiol-disulfide isomerase/thioredoxin